MQILITDFMFFATFIAPAILKGFKSAENSHSNKYLIIEKEKDISKQDSFLKYLKNAGDETELVWKAYLARNGMEDDDWTPFSNKNDSDATDNKRPRRQMTKKDQKQASLMAEMMSKMEEKGPKEDIVNEPYWQSGEWVFLRTGTPPVTEVTEYDPAGTTTNHMQIYRGCDRSCSYYFKTYGKVCGHRYNTHTWKNEYQNFNSICDIELKNCVDPKLRPNWHPLHRGPCNELKEFVLWQTEGYDLVQRKQKWDPYTYKVPTQSNE